MQLNRFEQIWYSRRQIIILEHENGKIFFPDEFFDGGADGPDTK